MKEIKRHLNAIDILKLKPILKHCNIEQVSIPYLLNLDNSTESIPTPSAPTLKALHETIKALFNVILELSENPSLDRQGELLGQSKKYINLTKIQRMLKTKDTKKFNEQLDILDELDSYIENKLNSSSLKSEKIQEKENDLMLNVSKKESLLLTFLEEPEEPILLEQEQTKIQGDPLEKRISNFLQNGHIVKR